MNPKSRGTIADRVRAQLRRLIGGPADVTSGPASPNPTPDVSEVGTHGAGTRTDDEPNRAPKVAPETATPEEDITANLGLIPDASAPEGVTPVEDLRPATVADDASDDEGDQQAAPVRKAPDRSEAAGLGGNYGSGNLQTGSRGSLGLGSDEPADDGGSSDEPQASSEMPGEEQQVDDPAGQQAQEVEGAGADLSRTGFHADVQAEVNDTGRGDFDPGATSEGPNVEAPQSRDGADLSRTGLYADIRGEVDSESSALTSDDTPYAGPAGTPLEETVATGPPDTAGPGNLVATSGDDYSAERSADVRATEPADSTTTGAIGQEMPSGGEFSTLVDRREEADLTNITVDVDTSPRVETSGRYAGAVRGDGTATTPPGFPIKGNASSKIYHTPDLASYRDTKPDWCFATAEEAEAAGFRAPRARNQKPPGRDDAESTGRATEPTSDTRSADPS